jgi:hypothetical protein
VYTFGRVHRYIADNLENSDTTKVNSELKIHKMVSVSLLSFASATTIVRACSDHSLFTALLSIIWRGHLLTTRIILQGVSFSNAEFAEYVTQNFFRYILSTD